MENFLLRPQLSAVLDESDRKRALHNQGSFGIAFWRAVPVDPRCLSLCRTLDQIWRALSRAGLHDFLSIRSDRAAENSSVPISDGRRRALSLLSAPALDLRVYRIRLCVSDRGGCLDNTNHVVLPIFPRRWCAHVDD